MQTEIEKPSPLCHFEEMHSKELDAATNSTDTNSSGYSHKSASSCSHSVRRSNIVHQNHTHHYSVRRRDLSECKERVQTIDRQSSEVKRLSIAESTEDFAKSSPILTYFCDEHDPRPILQAEQLQPNRVKVQCCRERNRRRMRAKPLGAKKQDARFQYHIAIGGSQQDFECRPSMARDMYEALREDPKISKKVQFVETHYLRSGIRGKLKRLCTPKENISREIKEMLTSLAEIDDVLEHPMYLKTIGAGHQSKLYQEITQLLDQVTSSSEVEDVEFNMSSDSIARCMCSMYLDCIKRYGEVCASRNMSTIGSTGLNTRPSHIISESLMFDRRALAFYNDTVFILDKRNFRVNRGLKRCVIYGFGSHELFEVIRVSRRHWLFQLHQHGPLLRLSLRKYVDNMVTRHVVYIRRWLPKAELSAHRSSQGKLGECICFVEKTKVKGLACTLMSEVITQGKITSAIRVHPSDSSDLERKHYVTTSEISLANCENPLEICSSCLSVPKDVHKHIQWLHVTCGSDVLTYLAIAVSYDLLVRKLSYWRDGNY